ncbi:MAG: ABC transporter permease [Fusobacteriaceae bacterium]
MKKLVNIKSRILNYLPSIVLLSIIFIVWEFFVKIGVINKIFTPAPSVILVNTIKILGSIMPEIMYSLAIAISGLVLSIMLSIFLCLLMDSFNFMKRSLYPIIIISQLLPTIVVAPLYVLWFGYGVLPKILLIISFCFFPITVNMLDAISKIDENIINLIKNMGGTKKDIFKIVKIPIALKGIISGVKISTTFCLTGALIAEWLGGTRGLGVYMMAAKRSYNYVGVFSVLLIIVLLSLFLIGIIFLLEKLFFKKYIQ